LRPYIVTDQVYHKTVSYVIKFITRRWSSIFTEECHENLQ